MAYAGDERRTQLKESGPTRELDWSQMIEKEPVTVILSQRGWIKGLRGHVALYEVAEMKWREGDGPHLALHAQTTDKLLVMADNGRVYTLGGDKLPGGRGFGEPLRLTIDLEAEAEVIAMMVVKSDTRLLVASSDRRGFVTSGEAVIVCLRLARCAPIAKRCASSLSFWMQYSTGSRGSSNSGSRPRR